MPTRTVLHSHWNPIQTSAIQYSPAWPQGSSTVPGELWSLPKLGDADAVSTFSFSFLFLPSLFSLSFPVDKVLDQVTLLE